MSWQWLRNHQQHRVESTDPDHLHCLPQPFPAQLIHPVNSTFTHIGQLESDPDYFRDPQVPAESDGINMGVLYVVKARTTWYKGKCDEFSVQRLKGSIGGFMQPFLDNARQMPGKHRLQGRRWFAAVATAAGMVAATAAMAAPPTVNCSTDPSIFNTAYNGSGGVLPVGSTDAHWETSVSPNGPWTAAGIPSPNPAWVASPFGNAAWIDQPSPLDRSPVYYRYQFNLDPQVNPAALALQMDLYVDDTMQTVSVNGHEVQNYVDGAHPVGQGWYGSTGQLSVTLNSSWKSGLNELILKTYNETWPSGLLVQMRIGNATGLCRTDIPQTLSAASVPVNARWMLALSGLLLAGAGAMLARKRG